LFIGAPEYWIARLAGDDGFSGVNRINESAPAKPDALF
jgi:hypothetical protein